MPLRPLIAAGLNSKKWLQQIISAAALSCALAPHGQAQTNEVVKLTASDGFTNDQFGRSVATNGNIVVIGAPRDDDNDTDSGSVYVFDSASGQELAKLTASEGSAQDLFGWSVALSGNIAVIGAFQDQDNGTDSGSVYIFDTSTGIEIRKLTASDGSAGDFFGASVAVDGNIALIGAPYDGGSGSAYLFNIVTGQELGKLTASDGYSGDSFGWSVALSGSVAVVGAYRDQDNGIQSGSAYLFDVNTGQELTKITPLDGSEQDSFGLSVAASGNVAVIGALGDDTDPGSAYVFDLTTGNELFKLMASDGSAGDRFGVSVAVSGRTAMIGSILDSDLGAFSGAAYAFDVNTGLELEKLLPSDGAAQDRFGGAVSVSGDIAVIGARYDDNSGPGSGSAYVFAGFDGDCDGDGLVNSQELDCNANDVPDSCEIANTPSLDQDLNGILDACETSGPFFVRNPTTGRLFTAIGADTWIGARAFGTSNNLHLATVEDEAMNTWLRQVFDLPSYWVGYHDAAVEGAFEWSSGRPVTYESWAPGAPNSFAADQDFTAVDGATGLWDTYFSNTSLPAILETLAVDCDGNGTLDDEEIALDQSLDFNGDGLLDSCQPPNYCVGGINSTGTMAIMGASGSPILLDNDLTLEAAQLPSGQWSYFVMSLSQAFVPGFAGSQGNLCVGPPIVRFNLTAGPGGQIAQTSAAGTRNYALDFSNLPQQITFQPGETWNFQLWFRDQNPGLTSNTTDGISVMFR